MKSERKLQNLLAVFFIAAVSIQSGQAKAVATIEQNSPEEAIQNEKGVLRVLWPYIKSRGVAARIYYVADCLRGSEAVLFPKVRVLPFKGSGNASLETIRSTFRADARVAVDHDASGIIRVAIGDVPSTLLETRISAINLSPLGRYNDFLAIGAIESAPEISAAMRRLNLRVPRMLFNVIPIQPTEGLPHMPASMTKTTMDKALDQVAKSFGGIVLYGVCPQFGLLDVSFVGGANFDDQWLENKGTRRGIR